MRSLMHPHPPKGPNGKQNITDIFASVTNNLPPPICQSTPETNCLTSAQSSSELDDMIDETIQQVTCKLHQTIMTSDIDNFEPDRTTGEILNKSITTPA